MPSRYIRIFDTTLRDGEQTPGVALTVEDKLTIARQLDKLGVDVIEAGFPVTSKGEAEAVKLIANDGLRAEICGLSRALKSDIDAVIDCDLNSIHLFIATSDIHLKYKLKMSREEVLRRALEALDYAKAHGLIVEFSAEDATRTDLDFLKEFYKALCDAGVDRVNVPDTVGVMTPRRMYELICELKKVVYRPLSVHCHDDFGMATSNSLAALEAGAEQVHVTVNGLGERAGNAALEEVVVALKLIYGFETNIDTKLIYQTSRLVSRLTGIPVQPNKAVVGENAFAHESGIHTHGVIVQPLTYEPIPPELVGRERRILAGKHAGTHGLRALLSQMGLELSEDQIKEVLARVKELGDKGKQVTEEDLMAIARIVAGELVKEERVLSLDELAVMTGNRVIPTASVKVSIDGKDYVTSKTGVGPVDAAIKALQEVLNPVVKVNLKEYRLEAITGGSDALAEVVVKVEDDEGHVVSARAAREDIVMASVEAMVNAINKLLLRKRITSSRG
jgi:isopropylmalate/citramalate/homocitrate synthase-like protein